jgi:GT2 family glycosyltransferase
MKKVLVIVVTYNGMQWIERCLSSVIGDARSGPGMTCDVYVWDNDSTDGSAEYVEAHFPQAKLVRSAENLGFSKPNNKGMEYALEHGYDYVYLLNQDAWLEEGALEKLVAAAEAHPEYGILSPLQMTDGYKGLDYQFEKRLPVKPAMTTPPTPSCPAPTGHLIDVEFVMAAHWLVRVSAIRSIGLFNEDLFPHWGQDDDWCQRLRYIGLKIGVLPSARAVHDRALRDEPLEKLVKRNYYTASLLRLVNPLRPLWMQILYVLLFTLVKSVKYRSLLPFKYLRTIAGQSESIRKHRALVRMRA